MNKKIEEAVREEKKYKLQRISPYKKAIITVSAIGLALLLAIAGGITLTSVNSDKFNIDLNDYNRMERIDTDPGFGKSVTEKIKYATLSDAAIFNYDLTNTDDVNFFVNPNNVTLIDDNPVVEDYTTDGIFKDCKNALINNFNDSIEEVIIDKVNIGTASNIEAVVKPIADTNGINMKNIDKKGSNHATLYEVLTGNEGLLVSSLNFVPYHQISESAAKKAINKEEFTTANIRVGNRIETFDNFVGVNNYDQDGTILTGIVVSKNGTNYEYFVSNYQYSLQGTYDSSDLMPMEDSGETLYAEGTAFPGLMPNLKDVYVTNRPFGDYDANEMYTNFIYIMTKDNVVIKADKSNVYALVKNYIDDTESELDETTYDTTIIGINQEKIQGVETDNNMIPTNNSIGISYVAPDYLDEGGYIVFDKPVTVSINVPGLEQKVPVIAYKIDHTLSGSSDKFRFDRDEIIELVIYSEDYIESSMGYIYYMSYKVPVQSVMFAGKNVEVEASYSK